MMLEAPLPDSPSDMATGPQIPPPLRVPHKHPPGEVLNLLTHGLGLILTLLALDRMVAAVSGGQNLLRIAGCIIYITTLVGGYAASTLSHSFRDPRLRC